MLLREPWEHLPPNKRDGLLLLSDRVGDLSMQPTAEAREVGPLLPGAQVERVGEAFAKLLAEAVV